MRNAYILVLKQSTGYAGVDGKLILKNLSVRVYWINLAHDSVLDNRVMKQLCATDPAVSFPAWSELVVILQSARLS
jgi:hypothetical protein